MKTNVLLINLVVIAGLLLAGCSSDARVGPLRSESRSVELEDAASARVDIEFGAGDLDVTGGAAKLLEADFTYNVAKLQPELEQTGSTVVVRQPDVSGLPVLQDIGDFRNEWDVRLDDQVPMDLRVNVGGGTTDLQLAGLSLTRLDVTLGAGQSTLDLNGDWARDLDVTIDASAADMTVQLPRNIGVRLVVDPGAAVIDAPDLQRDGEVYTNAAYGVSDVTLHVDLKAGIGRIGLELADQ